MEAILSKQKMERAVDDLLVTMGLTRADFADERDSWILAHLGSRFEAEGSVAASMVTRLAANAARELEGYTLKICPRCGREFWILSYLAPKPVFDRCGRVDCVRASVPTQ